MQYQDSWRSAQPLAAPTGFSENVPGTSGYVRSDKLLLAAARSTFYAGLLTSGFLVIRPIGGVTLSDLFVLMSFALLLCHKALVGGVITIKVPRATLVGAYTFALGALVSSAGADRPLESIELTTKFLFIVCVWLPLGAKLLDSFAKLAFASACWVLSVALSGAGALAQRFVGLEIGGSIVHYGRYSGFTGHVSDLGGMSAIALIPAVALLMVGATKLSRVLFLGPCIALIVSGLLLSGSVSSMASAAAGCALFLIILRRRSFPLILTATVVIYVTNLWLGFLSYVISRPAERFTYVTGNQGNDDASLWARVQTYRDALESIVENPFVGTGLHLGGTRTESGFAVHNVLLGPWYEAGFFGFVGMLIILATVSMVTVWNIRHLQNESDRTFVGALGCSVVVFLLFAQSAPILYQRYAWMAVMLLFSYHMLRGRDAAGRTSIHEGNNEPSATLRSAT